MATCQAVVVGAGASLSASLARKLAARGMGLAPAARDTSGLAPLAEEPGARTVAMDGSDSAGRPFTLTARIACGQSRRQNRKASSAGRRTASPDERLRPPWCPAADSPCP